VYKKRKMSNKHLFNNRGYEKSSFNTVNNNLIVLNWKASMIIWQLTCQITVIHWLQKVHTVKAHSKSEKLDNSDTMHQQIAEIIRHFASSEDFLTRG